MQRWLDIALGILVGAILAWIAVWLALPPRGKTITLQPPPPTSTPAPLWVDVEGAVTRPGVYALPQGSRVRDAIQAAGGTTREALPEALNLAARLQDGMRVYVPFRGTPTPVMQISTTIPLSTGERININTASAETLETLPHIGPTLAQRIVAYRAQHGPFQSIDDLVAVKGIGPNLLDDIRDLITVGP